MATLNVTKDKGGAGRPEGMTVVEPSREVPVAVLQAIGKNAGLDGVVLADIISALAMHERASARFARAATQQTDVPQRRKLYEELAQVHSDRVTVLETLLNKLKAPALYVSPASRMAGNLAESLTQASLLAGSVDVDTRECMLLDVATLMAEKSLAGGHALANIAKAAQPSSTRVTLDKAVKTMSAGISTLEQLRGAQVQAMMDAVLGNQP